METPEMPEGNLGEGEMGMLFYCFGTFSMRTGGSPWQRFLIRDEDAFIDGELITNFAFKVNLN